MSPFFASLAHMLGVFHFRKQVKYWWSSQDHANVDQKKNLDIHQSLHYFPFFAHNSLKKNGTCFVVELAHRGKSGSNSSSYCM